MTLATDILKRYGIEPQLEPVAPRPKENGRTATARGAVEELSQYTDVIRHFSGILMDWEMAELMGLTLHQVRNYARYSGITVAVLRKRWTEEEEDRLLTMLSNGVTQVNAANRLGRTTRAVAARVQYLRESGKIPPFRHE